jgi:eukaryotic-like serine/threonine-protein kinase
VTSRGPGSDLWLSDASGAKIERFTFDRANNTFPIWSPDGSRIIWASTREGMHHLYQKAASGSGQEELLLRSDYPKSPSHWSRDGRFIIYQQTEPKTKRDLWVLPVTGDQKPFAFLQTPANEEERRLSPDGRWMAYVSDESGRYEVYVQSFPSRGGKRQVSTGGGIAAQWRGDGKELFYQAPDGKLMVVEVKSGASFETDSPKPLFEFRAIDTVGTYPSYTATADGQRFMISTLVGNESSEALTVVVNWAVALKR